ncbi:hypothetical protein DSUL_20402 [Desulfovibrionales bacterium]
MWTLLLAEAVSATFLTESGKLRTFSDQNHWNSWPFSIFSYEGGFWFVAAKFLFIAMLLGMIALLLRHLFGPGGPLRDKGWETIQEGRGRRRDEVDAQKQAITTSTNPTPFSAAPDTRLLKKPSISEHDKKIIPAQLLLRNQFLAYVETFRYGPIETLYNINLKREHSLQVLDNANAITATLDLSLETAQLAQIAALVHDAGRFPQYQCYKTFCDKNSKNHAQLGIQALRTAGFLDKLPAPERKLVLAAVILHNRNELPKKISPKLACISKVVRDADKLDIMRIMLAHFQRKTEAHPTVTLHMSDEPTAYTSTIYATILAGRMGDYNAMRYINDFILLVCGWSQHLAFAVSRRLVQERGLLDSLLICLPELPEMTILSQTLRHRLAQSVTAEL